MRLGTVVLLAALAFAALMVLDLGGLRTRLFADRDERAPEITPKLPAPVAQKPAAPITPAWFLDASGYDGAELERQAARVNLVVYFQRRKCDPCRRFERDVLGAPEVKSFLQDVVKVRVDPDDGDAERKLAMRFGVSEVPAVAVVPHQGPPRLLPPRALSNPHLLIAFSR
jgi:hypothetical protein